MFPHINRNEFRNWLKVKNLSPKTIHFYMSYYDKYTCPDITRHNLMEFLLTHNNLPCRAFIKNLLTYAKGIDLPVDVKQTLLLFEIPAQSGHKASRIPDYISKDYALAIAQAMPNIKFRFMTLITFYGGLRRAELLNIKPYDFNWEYWQNNPERNGCLKVFGKNSKERIVFIPASLMAEVLDWIKVSVAPKYPKERPLFKVSKSKWNAVLHDVSIKALGKAIHPHTLRHSTATYLMEKGLQIREIQEYLGHASITSTQIYTHVNNDILRDKINQIM